MLIVFVCFHICKPYKSQNASSITLVSNSVVNCYTSSNQTLILSQTVSLRLELWKVIFGYLDLKEIY